MRTLTLTVTLAAVSAIGLGSLALAQRGQDAPNARAGHQPAGMEMGAMLVEGLRRTPGCLGVDAADFTSGKNAIFAWFEDKAAVVRWYDSQVHRQAMQLALGPKVAGHDHEPLAHVEDDVPIMVIASITFSAEPEIEGVPMPVSQLAIELYSPQPGGASINGRLAPEGFRIEHMKCAPKEAAMAGH